MFKLRFCHLRFNLDLLSMALSLVVFLSMDILLCIDDCLNGYSPTFIKMDIQGSELESLKRCRHMIISTRPELAISVYHVPDHLWKIPLLIKKMIPDYECFLR